MSIFAFHMEVNWKWIPMQSDINWIVFSRAILFMLKHANCSTNHLFQIFTQAQKCKHKHRDETHKGVSHTCTHIGTKKWDREKGISPVKDNKLRNIQPCSQQSSSAIIQARTLCLIVLFTTCLSLHIQPQDI